MVSIRQTRNRKAIGNSQITGVQFNIISQLAQDLKEEVTLLLNLGQESRNPSELHVFEWLDVLRSRFGDFLGITSPKQIDEFPECLALVLPQLLWVNIADSAHSEKNSVAKTLWSNNPFTDFLPPNSILSENTHFAKIILTLKAEFQSLLCDFPNVTEEQLWDHTFAEFLTRFNKKEKNQRGIIYTLQPIVDFMLDGVDQLLRTWVNMPEGTQSPNVAYLDPAAGLMNFTCGFLNKMHTAGLENDSPLRLFWAYEILPSQVILGRIRVLRLLDKYYHYGPDNLSKIHILWKNALSEVPEELFPLDGSVFPVVLGNPPYNVSSQNKSPWIQELMEDYKRDLQRAGTKRISVSRLQDDYAKFFRFAQWIIDQAGQGLVVFITSRSYIDGLVHRGMRASLTSSFNEIYVVDLNGDSRDFLPDGSNLAGGEVDENIFPIQQGVAITFLIKYKSKTGCKVYYSGFTGSRKVKLDALSLGFDQLHFKEVQLDQDISFRPTTGPPNETYMQFPYLLDIFKEHVQGIVSAHDSLVFDADQARLKLKIETFLDGGNISALGASARDGRDWKIDEARAETTSQNALSHIIPCAYRGFDRRWLCYDLALINKGTNRFPLMQYLVQPGNIAIVTNRLSVTPMDVLVADCVVDNGMVSGARASRSYIFPLKIGEGDKSDNEVWNIRPEFFESFHFTTSPTELFYYVYGILNTPAYAGKYYQEILKDFPRIPFPLQSNPFKRMAEKGEILARLHLLEDGSCDFTQWPMNPSAEDLCIRRVTYDPSVQQIYFDKPKDLANRTQPFWVGGITPEMWTFQIGGIRQLKQWLNARKFSLAPNRNTIPRGLLPEELRYFCKMCSAIQQTLAMRPELDALFLKIEEGQE